MQHSHKKSKMRQRRKYCEKLLIYLIIFLTIFTSCSDKSRKYSYINYKKLERPDNRVKLNSTVVNKDIFAPGPMAIIKNYLIFIDHKAGKIIKINDLESCKLFKSFGSLGQGPNEFIGASQIIPDPKNEDIFWIYDVSTRKLVKYDINKVFNDEFEPEEIVNIIEGNGPPFHLIITPGEKILGIGLFFKGRISVYNMNGDFIRRIGKIPVILKNERFGPQHSHGFTGKFVLRNRSKEIYIATLNGAIIEKYNIENGKLISTFYGPDSFFPEYEIVPAGQFYTITFNEKTRYGYLDICYNQKLDKIFLLYSGKYFFNKDKNPAYLSNIIYVLDDKGKIIEQIELDREIFHMIISEDGSIIFGETESEIIKFEYFEYNKMN